MYDDKNARRGYVPEDRLQFMGVELQKLKEAAKDTLYLLNRGYSVKNATTPNPQRVLGGSPLF